MELTRSVYSDGHLSFNLGDEYQFCVLHAKIVQSALGY